MKSTAEALNSESPRFQVVTSDSSKSSFKNSNKEEQEICLTSGCVHAASLMLDQMDETVEPCDDFCKFIKITMIWNKIIIADFRQLCMR